MPPAGPSAAVLRPARFAAAAAAVVSVLALLATAAPARAGAAADTIGYTVRVTDINRVGLTVSNYGFFGNNFVSRTPSFEFPLGSGYEHMSRAGLWVGAEAISDSGSFIGVSTAIVDNAQGSVAKSETEFTPRGTAIVERSRIANSPHFSPDAISDQDLECAYTDRPSRSGYGYSNERHRSMNLTVRQTTLGFSLKVADAFVVVRFQIVNDGPPLRNAYVGLYSQFASGDKNAYGLWPPAGGASWYYNAYVSYDSTRRMYRERYCRALPYPAACDTPYCPPWAAVRLLAVHPDTIANKTVSLHWWSWSPGSLDRDTDQERYAILSDGVIMDPLGCIPGQGCSPIMVLSVGPFAQVFTGDTVTVDYAYLGGETLQALEEHADFAQFASDIGYRLPAPPPSPRMHVETSRGRVDLYWDDSPEQVPDPTSPAPGGLDFEGYRVYFGPDRQNPLRVAQFDVVDTTGFNTGLDSLRLATPLVVDGVAYRYHRAITGLRDGFRYYGAVTSYDTGDQKVESLESGISQNKFVAVTLPSPAEAGGDPIVFPNPYRVEARWDQGAQVRDHYLWFARLPARCRLSVYTLGGDRVFETRFDGAQYHGESARGLYDPRQDLDTPPPVLSGASYAWNLITDQGQALATGLYLFIVEDLDTRRVTRGKFLVVKSDREQ
jgi:hypothetical protein